MERFNRRYIAFLFFAFFIFYPLNNLLITLNLSPTSTLAPMALVIIVGLAMMLLDYTKLFYVATYRVPIFSLFSIFTIALIILESYIYNSVYYVPSKYLNAANAYWIFFSIGSYIFVFYFEDLIKLFKENILLTIFLSSLFVLIFFIFVSYFGLFSFLSRTVFHEMEIEFQSLSDYIVLGSFILISKYFYNNKILIVIAVIVLIELFILGSRSSIFFYIASIFFLFIKNRRYTFIFTIGIIAFLLLTYFMQDIINFYSGDTRIMSMFSGDYANDASLKEREEQFLNNLKFIEQNWLTGGIYSEFLIAGEGTYIHNYISYLQNFGIVPFALINILFVKIIYSLATYNGDSFEFRLIFLMSVFALLSILFSRSYVATWVLLVFAMSEAFFNRTKETTIEKDTSN